MSGATAFRVLLLRGQSFVNNNHRDCGAANRNVIVTATAKARKTLQDDERAVAGAVHDDEGKRWGCRCPNPPPRQIKTPVTRRKAD